MDGATDALPQARHRSIKCAREPLLAAGRQGLGDTDTDTHTGGIRMTLPQVWFDAPRYSPGTERTIAQIREHINFLQKEMYRVLCTAIPHHMLVPGDTKAGTALATGGQQMDISAGSEWRDGTQQQMIQEASVRPEPLGPGHMYYPKGTAPQRQTVTYEGRTYNRTDLGRLQEAFAEPLPIFQNGDLVSWADGFEGIVIKSGHVASLLDRSMGVLGPLRIRVICTKGGMRGCSYSPLTESLVKL